MNLTPVTLEGASVRLVPVALEHAEGLLLAGLADEIWDYMPYTVQTLPAVQRFLKDAWAGQDKGTDLVFAVIEKETNRIVGSTRYLDIQQNNRSLEIGWTWLHPSVWRSRVNSECKYLLLRHAFETLGCIRVQIKTDARNVRSQTAIARLGAVREGTLRQQRILSDGFFRDTVYFSILDSEWASVKERLEGFCIDK